MPKEKPHRANHWASMSRIGKDFGWSTKTTSQAFRDHGLRDDKGIPTELGLTLAKKFPLPMAPDFFKWHSVSVVDFLVQAGYKLLAPTILCASTLDRFAKLSYDKNNRYYSRPGQRQAAVARCNTEASKALRALSKLSSCDRTAALVDLNASMEADGWPPSEIREVFTGLGVAPHDLHAAQLQVQTPPVEITRSRRTL